MINKSFNNHFLSSLLVHFESFDEHLVFLGKRLWEYLWSKQLQSGLWLSVAHVLVSGCLYQDWVVLYLMKLRSGYLKIGFRLEEGFQCFGVVFIFFFEFHELRGRESIHDGVAQFSRERYKGLIWRVLDLGGHHIGRDGRHMHFLAILTAIASCIILHLFAAIWTTQIKGIVVVLNTSHVTTYLKELRLVVPLGTLIRVHCIYHLFY